MPSPTRRTLLRPAAGLAVVGAGGGNRPQKAGSHRIGDLNDAPPTDSES